MKINIGSLEEASLVDGPGVRFVIFTTGCIHNCPGCHNKELQEYENGKEYNIREIIERIESNVPFIDGITLSGGDPLFQLHSTTELLRSIKASSLLRSLNIWLYTGFRIEDVPKSIRKYVDCIVDGRYIRELPEGKFRGSINQLVWTKYPGTNKFFKTFYDKEYTTWLEWNKTQKN